jgi:hypothetical protein
MKTTLTSLKRKPGMLKVIEIEYNFLQEVEIYTVKDGSSYRCFVNKDYFILNEESYGLLTKPV